MSDEQVPLGGLVEIAVTTEMPGYRYSPGFPELRLVTEQACRAELVRLARERGGVPRSFTMAWYRVRSGAEREPLAAGMVTGYEDVVVCDARAWVRVGELLPGGGGPGGTT